MAWLLLRFKDLHALVGKILWRNGSLFKFIALNWVLAQIVCLGYWWHLGKTLSALDVLFVVAGYASYLGLVCVILMIPLQMLSSISKLTARIAGIVVFSIVHLLLISDWNLYNQMHFHINGAAVAILGSRAGIASLNLTSAIIFFIIATIIAAIVVQVGLVYINENVRKLDKVLNSRNFAIGVFSSLIIQSGIYVYADSANATRTLALAHRIPFYQPIEMRSYTAGIIAVPTQVHASEASSNSDFHYGSIGLRMEENAATPDIYIIALDSLRADLLTEDSAPNMLKFAQGSDVFAKHISGGNQTRHGVFSLFYGIPASYWNAALRTRVPPAMMVALRHKGYDIQVFSSANLDHPEFKETVFRGVDREFIHDHFKGDGPLERDILATASFNDFVQKKSPRPKFGFLFLDGTHGPYHSTARARKFLPDGQSYFLAYDPSGQIEANKNSYLNSVVQADMTLRETLELLDVRSRQKNPPVMMITSDHGEEFLEHGFRGHCSAFTMEQVRVPLYVRGLNAQNNPKTFTRFTSHDDVVFSILERLRVENASELTAGVSLYAQSREYAISCGWDQCAVISDQHVTVFGTEPYNAMKVERYDGDYKSPGRDAEVSPYLREAFSQMTRFFGAGR